MNLQGGVRQWNHKLSGYGIEVWVFWACTTSLAWCEKMGAPRQRSQFSVRVRECLKDSKDVGEVDHIIGIVAGGGGKAWEWGRLVSREVPSSWGWEYGKYTVKHFKLDAMTITDNKPETWRDSPTLILNTSCLKYCNKLLTGHYASSCPCKYIFSFLNTSGLDYIKCCF